MAPNPASISHVSDTALMTAACRALETDRPDGWVRDPLAARLAGERGFAIARALPALEIMSFGVGMRTCILDDVVTKAISAHGISTVLSIGAGLDTRPWRLEVPSDLRWVEVDLPAILDYKADLLAAEHPKCRIERLVADLNDPEQRHAMFATVSEQPSLMITEGLLMYLPAATVEALATEAVQLSGIRYWLMDLATGALAKAVRMSSFKEIEALRAPDNLDGNGIIDVAKRYGWTSVESHTYAVQGMQRMPQGRLEAMARLAAGRDIPPPPPPTDLSGVHLFGRG
jgi:methyltransferase (TIGR00027 family)